MPDKSAVPAFELCRGSGGAWIFRLSVRSWWRGLRGRRYPGYIRAVCDPPSSRKRTRCRRDEASGRGDGDRRAVSIAAITATFVTKKNTARRFTQRGYKKTAHVIFLIFKKCKRWMFKIKS